jgi:adenylate cyclase
MGKRPPEELMRSFLAGEEKSMTRARGLFRRLPSSPHCKLCAAPFAGPGGVVLSLVGFSRFPGNPMICNVCIGGLQKTFGVMGAEIPVSLLFADIRGSTGIGERMRPVEFRAYLDRFYRITSAAVLDHSGVVDKFVGDEVIGLFFAGISGPGHAAAAVDAARALLEGVGRADATSEGPIPVGAAVHTGEAYVGSTGVDGAVNDFTALGDAVNTTARLASAAVAGELLVSLDAARAATLGTADLERRMVDVRGRSQPIEVVSISARSRSPVASARPD